MFKQIITNDEADWYLLKLANEKGKFAIQVGMTGDAEQQAAFERGIDNVWFTLVDIGPIAYGPVGIQMRVFRLTPAGRDRRERLGNTYGDD